MLEKPPCGLGNFEFGNLIRVIRLSPSFSFIRINRLSRPTLMRFNSFESTHSNRLLIRNACSTERILHLPYYSLVVSGSESPPLGATYQTKLVPKFEFQKSKERDELKRESNWSRISYSLTESVKFLLQSMTNP